MPPRWTRGAKEAVGTAYSTASRVWYTVAAGILTEIFYPTIDTPQIRDLQFLITDGQTFFHDERRNTISRVDCVDEASLGFDIINVAFKGTTWMALGATAPLLRCSCGYVAVNDGWTDLHDNRTLDWQYDAV